MTDCTIIFYFLLILRVDFVEVQAGLVGRGPYVGVAQGDSEARGVPRETGLHRRPDPTRVQQQHRWQPGDRHVDGILRVSPG